MSMTFTPPKASEIERAASIAFFAWYKGRPSHAGTYLMWGQHAADTYGGQWCEILSKGLNDAIRN